MVYKLSKTLIGHEQDVKDVATTPGDAVAPRVVSCSRDGTIRAWSLSDQSHSIVFHSSTNSFINAVCCLDDNLVASGGKDNVVFINSLDEPVNDVGIYNLIGHQNNICSLHHRHNKLISSSWDGTAKVWDLSTYECVLTLKSDTGMSVLDAVIVDDNRYLTCSADKYIRFWNGNSVTHIFKGHTDVVRKLLLLGDGTFASCSNDGTIKIWSLEGTLISTLSGHESFIYDLVALPNGLLVSAGEDRSVRIWKGQALLQAITLPCISNWCLTNVGNDIVVGSSDNSIRIFTSDPERYAAKEDLERFEESVKTSTIAEQSVDINKTDVPGYERLEVHGTEGQTVMVKSPVGVIEAYQWSNGQWNKIGDVVGSSASSDKKVHNGKEYDYVFDVDFEDGKPPLKLPYNAGDNTYTVANQFLADNELPASYVQDVVAFLEKNTQGVSLTETSDSVETKAQVSLSVLPVTQYIQFKDINSSQLNRGLTKFNDSQTHKLSSIPTNFDVSSSEAADMITNLVPQVFEWDESSYLVGFDLLRSLIGKLGISDILKNENLPELVQSFIEKGAASENPSVLMMFGRFLNNLVDSVLFMQIYADSEGDNVTFSSALFQLLDTLTQKKVDQHHKHYNQCITGFSTLIYNLSAVQVKQKVGSGDLAKYINDTNIEEANYRLLIALGNLKYIKAVATPLPSWAHKHSEPRFISLFNDINSL